MVMPPKLTINAYSSGIIIKMVSVSKHLKGVAVSIDGTTTERQFIQTLIILNIYMGFTQKGVLAR